MGGRVNPREFVRREDNGFVNRQTRGFPRAGHISALGIFREYVLSERGIISGGGRVIFKPLSQHEYERLSLDERMEYLHRLMTDIRQKLAETRKQQETLNKRIDDSGR
jgi:hypothetical protein